MICYQSATKDEELGDARVSLWFPVNLPFIDHLIANFISIRRINLYHYDLKWAFGLSISDNEIGYYS